MAESNDTRRSPAPIARRDRAYAGHACLCASMLAWRMIESTPGVSAAQNGAFPGSPAGAALTMILVWLGVASLAVVVASTFMTRSDARLWILFALMSLSMIWRRDIDVFDVTYAALTAILSAWWFNSGRARMKSGLLAPMSAP